MCQVPWFSILFHFAHRFTVLFAWLCIIFTQRALAIDLEPEPHGSLAHENITYTSPAFKENKYQELGQLSGRIIERAHGSDAETAVDLEGNFSSQFQELNSMGVNELYMRLYPSWLNHRITVGRHLETWSDLDEAWRFGITQPLFRIDEFKRHSQGLTGVFLNFPRGRINISLFASPFFIPTQGPKYEVRNGEFIETSPWVSLPPSQMDIMEVNTPIQYRIETPELENIVFKSSFGFKFETIDDNYEVRAGVLSKPANTLGLGADMNLKVGSESFVDVKLHPQVRHHVVKTLDVTHKINGGFSYGFSWLQEEPERQSFEPQWTYFEYSEKQLLSSRAKWVYRHFGIELNYLAVSKAKTAVYGPKADLAKNIFLGDDVRNDLIRLRNTLNVPLKAQKKMTIDLEWLQDVKSRAEMISIVAQFYFHRYWKAFSGLDLVKSNSENDSFAMIAEKDRASLGVSYVF